MNSFKTICWNMTDPNVTSPGILIGEKSSVTHFLSYSIPLFELQFAIILMMNHGLSFFLGRFGISMFICQLLTGIILGPTVLGRLDFMKEVVFPIESHEVLNEVAMFGFLLHFFLNAVNINVESAKKLTGKFAIITGLASVLVPSAVGFTMLKPYIGYFQERGLLDESLRVVVLQSTSAFTVVVNVLKDFKIPNSEIGLLLLSSAMVSGGISLLFMVASTFFFGKLISLLTDSCAYIGLVIIIATVIRPVMLLMIEKVPVGSSVDSSFTCSVMLMALMIEAYCQIFHQVPGVGAYTFGIAVPAGPPLGSALIEKFESFVYSVFLPMCIVTSTMMADMTMIFTHFGEIRIYVMFVIVIGGVKVLSCLVPMLCWEIPFVDSLLFATIMASRGTIEIALCLILKERKLLTDSTYGLLIFNTLVTSLALAMIMKFLYDPTKNYAGYHDRKVISLKPDSQLRILFCVHDQDNIHSITGFLDVFHPTPEKFLDLHVVHLVPLTGFNTPMIMSHNNQKPTFDDSLSDNLIIYFNQYEKNNPEGISISTYTSFSPVCSMNDDISSIAFHHVASIIILPFHRKWSIHGRVESEDVNIRITNRKVLERAPCSVAIFFDRGKLGRRTKVSLPLGSPISICVIFLGGKDDWEALALAKRIAANTSSRLTIIHFMMKNESEDVEATRDKVAVEVMLKTNQQNQICIRNIEYVRKFVNDGTETAMTINSVADKYDLFVVGRRYGIESPKTSGLSKWIEFPELGIVGDILACKDVDTRTSVLVVQQQIKFS
ncbi:Cation/hydrogen exchanger family protein [Euphorbia peplus]|nr:Cation/hydrogen exchanger family protein [Euphorbia peplus]